VLPGPGAAGYIAAWQPSSVSAAAASFARAVVERAGPGSRERARNLLWAAGKLAGYGTGLGLDPVPEVLLHPSVIERFTAHAPGLSGPARRTLRTNLRFLARAVCCPTFGMSVAASLLVSVLGCEKAPPGGAGRGFRGSWCRGGVHSVVTSVTAVRAEDSSAMALPAAYAASRVAMARLLTARG
jgi:hypothetical protein